MKGLGRRALTVALRVLSHNGARLGAIFLVGLAALAFLAPWIISISPITQHLEHTLEGPSLAHWFGTDELGRDILIRVIYGARTSLETAAGAVAIAGAIGIPVGLVAGFFGGWHDALLMRAIDVLLALPAILLAMALIAVMGRSEVSALAAVGVTGIPSFARVTRAQVLSLRSRDFVVAVEAFGASAAYSMFRTVLPNSWSPIVVQVIVLSSLAILIEAALSFLGIGIAPPTPSWGDMLRTGASYLYDAPTYAVLPGIALTLTILSLDTIGRTLASVIEDPHAVDLALERESSAEIAAEEGIR
ncbi:MAG: ABC transporter permease [Acetobacteraceae bacterium]